MNRPLRWAAGLAGVAAAGATYAVAAGPADDRPGSRGSVDVPSSAHGPAEVQSSARGPALPSVRETPYQGLIARLPHIGALTWRCDDEQRFFTKLTLETPGAGVT